MENNGFSFVSDPYDIDGKQGVEVAVFDGDDELVFQDVPNPSVVRDKKADRIGIFSKDKSTGVSVSLPPKKKAKVAPETILFHTVNGSTKSVDQVPPAFATAVKKTLKSKSKKLLDESIEVSVKKGGSRLNKKGGRTKRNRRGHKRGQTRKLAARRR